MPTFERDDLHRLLEAHETPCVSLYMPTHRHPPENEQDPIRFRNLLREAERRLASHEPPASGLLQPVSELAEAEAWREPRNGLAVFRSPDVLAHYSIPESVEERVVVGDRFHVRPLLHALQRRDRYYVLALSQNATRLYEGTPSGLSRIEAGLPSSLEDALGSEHDPPFLNAHATARGSETAAFHGHGDGEDAQDEDLKRYFRAVDTALWRLLRQESVPLFVAAIARHISLYRELSRYPLVAERGIEGNVDEVGAEELSARVRPLVEELRLARRRRHAEEFAQARGKGLTEVDLHAIGPHAVQGRVRRLFLGDGRKAPGRVDAETGEVRDAGEEEGRADDVLDDLAQAVLVRDGEVVTLPAEEMPDQSVAVALLRW